MKNMNYMIGAFILALCIYPVIVDAQSSTLSHKYDEIGVSRACSYYELRNFDNLPSLTSKTLDLEQAVQIRGVLSGGAWEWKHLSRYIIRIVNETIPYDVKVCRIDNRTMQSVCGNEIRIEYTYSYEYRYRTTWTNYPDYKIIYDESMSLRNKDIQEVRYCADIEREVNGVYFDISIDLIPKYNDLIYSKLNWLNSSMTRYPLTQLNNNSNPFLVNDTFGVDIGGGVQYVWCNATSTFLYNDTNGNLNCADDLIQLPTFIESGNGTNYEEPEESLVTWMMMNGIVDRSRYAWGDITNQGSDENRSGKIANASYYLTTNTDYINLGNNAQYDITKEITVMGWFNQHYNGGSAMMISKEGGAGAGSWSLYASQGLKAYYVCQLFTDTPNTLSIELGAGVITIDDTWRHGAFTYNQASGILTCYLDGQVVGTAFDGGFGDIKITATEVWIGARPTSAHWSNGLIDDIRIYNRSLSSAEIEAYYNNTNPDGYSSIGTMQSDPTGFYDVTLISPPNGSVTTNTNPEMTFSYSGSFANASCELFIDGSSYGINATVFNLTNTIIVTSPSLSYGVHQWLINCTNGLFSRISELRTITIIEIPPSGSSIAIIKFMEKPFWILDLFSFWIPELFSAIVVFMNGLNVIGDSTFTGNLVVTENLSGNLHYGEIWNYSANATAWTFPIPSADIYYNLTNLTSSRINGFVYIHENQANGGSYLITQVSGTYKVESSLSFERKAGSGLYGISIAKNFNSANSRNCYSRRQGTNSAGSVIVTCLISLSAGDTINIQIEDESAPVQDILVHSVNLNLIRIGDE